MHYDNLGLMSTKDLCELGLVFVELGLYGIFVDEIGWKLDC
jgi:hypothetical protein